MRTDRVDLLIRNARIATMMPGSDYGIIDDAAIAIAGETIVWAGPVTALPADIVAVTTFNAERRWVTPGLVDCHTHIVYAGNRANEFEARLNGATYADIARSGGGIVSTVRAVRN